MLLTTELKRVTPYLQYLEPLSFTALSPSAVTQPNPECFRALKEYQQLTV